MQTIDTLEDILAFYKVTPAVGHTTAMLQGAANTPGVVILAATNAHAQQLQKIVPNSTCLSVSAPYVLRGRNSPLLLDSTAVEHLLTSAVVEIRRLERRVLSGMDKQNDSSQKVQTKAATQGSI